MNKIGFIGIGTMGRGMVKNLLNKGFRVFAYNRTRVRTEELNHEKLQIVDSAKEACEKAEIIIICVSNDSALDEVLSSENGGFQTLKEGKILVDCGTTSVDLTLKIAEECRRRGADFLDAPMTGSKTGAESGTIMFMVGGDKDVLDECMPIFNAMGSKAVYCGDNSYGQRAKIGLNLAQSLILEGYLEGLILGVKNGVPLEAMLEIFENSGPKNGVASAKIGRILKRDFTSDFKLELMRKDIGLASEEIKKLGLDLPLSKEISKAFEKAVEKGLGREDFSSIVKLLEENAKIELKK
ncbi:MAG: NAD(P)-dependent oxidoreductase [Candidatus Aenigmarchaeota archaeon]|nr:NAD(P)-dependent oxidoreductase [Candidatus Aenigmarchaeota archaeon]